MITPVTVLFLKYIVQFESYRNVIWCKKEKDSPAIDYYVYRL